MRPGIAEQLVQPDSPGSLAIFEVQVKFTPEAREGLPIPAPFGVKIRPSRALFSRLEVKRQSIGNVTARSLK